MRLLSPCSWQATGQGEQEKGREMQNLDAITNPQQQWYRNRQGLAKMRQVLRGVCSTHTFLVSSGEHAMPCSKGLLLTHTVELHVQLKDLATRNREPANSANWVLILLTSTNHLNFNWTPPVFPHKSQNRDQNPRREQILPGWYYP